MRFEDDIQFCKGIGPQKAKLYRRLGITTVGELVAHYPRDYIDLSRPAGIAELALGETGAVRARLVSIPAPARLRGKLSVTKLVADDDESRFTVTLFNAGYAQRSLRTDVPYVFYGVVKGGFASRDMPSPQIFPGDAAGLWPVYTATAGLSSRALGQAVRRALDALPPLPETLPPALLRELGLPGLDEALELVHRPPDLEAARRARRRLVFERLLLLALSFAALRRERRAAKAPVLPPCELAPFYAAFPFTATDSQLRCIGEIEADLAAGRPMNRLVAGDVGSGKTFVAAAACYMAAKAGGQAALMAPTEVLAFQHYETLSAALGKAGLRCALLTGSTKAAERRSVLAALREGGLDVIIGTHALLSEGVEYRRLLLAVTDEQHRFGVSQRAAFTAGEPLHTLVMSATPIPRTLALTLYGDLDVSTIERAPSGRLPVKTYRIGQAKRADLYGFIRRQLDAGFTAYIVCPAIDESEELPLAAASEYYRTLVEGPFADYRVALLHGRQKPEERRNALLDFKAGRIQLLVCTTVVEVGVDAPNAVLMVIENAERFGLSQLHQLRGRVGRGRAQSWCILVSDDHSPLAERRLGAICSSNDGFALAEQDLALRGPGDFLGTRQHGEPIERLIGDGADISLLTAAREAADALLEADPTLSQPENAGLRQGVAKLTDARRLVPN